MPTSEQLAASGMTSNGSARRDRMQFVADSWAALGFKAAMDAPDRKILSSWVGSHWRRLTAYKLLTAIAQNRARAFLAVDDDDVKARHREYGDAWLIVDTVRSAVTGDDVSIVIPGMEDNDAEARTRLEWLEEWGTSERLVAKVLETEWDCPKLGDGVYVIWGDTEKERPRLELYEAGFYFPFLDPNMPQSDFPRRVDIAWEYEQVEGDGTTIRWIRRKTWELGPIAPLAQAGLFRTEVLRAGDTRSERGTVTRKYAWNDKPSSLTCYFTDGHWRVDKLPPKATMDNPNAWGLAGRYEVLDGEEVVGLDLLKDYIPVVHLPNTVANKEHYGDSVLLRIAQALDELASADTDAALAAELAGLPMLGASGTTATDIEVRAGKVIGLGQNGKLDVLDLSASLVAVMAYVDKLQDRIVVNSRLTNEAMGRVDAASIKSGLHMVLSWGPMRSLVAHLRLTRNEKYPLLLKFVQREALLHGWITGPVQPATLAFGSSMPNDTAAGIEHITTLYAAHLISRQTAIKWLVDEGIVDLDVAKELKACEQEDFDRLIAKLEALGAGSDAIDEVWGDLGIKRPTPEPAPVGNGAPSNTPPSNTTGAPEVDPQTGAPVLDLGA